MDTENTAYPSDHLKNPLTEGQLLANEILAARTAWFFHGTCARGAKFPDGSVSKDSGADVTAGGSSENQIRYAETALRYSPKVSLLYYATHILSAARLVNNDRKPIVLSRVPSEISGIEEVVINGTCGTIDRRNTGIEYSLIQRINSAASQKLFDRVEKDPRFFEFFYRTSFPGFDSARDSFDGLYRFLSPELILLEPQQLQIFAEAFPAKLNWRNDGTFDNPVFSENEALGLLGRGRKITLTSPVGVGTVQDFLNIKAKIRKTGRC